MTTNLTEAKRFAVPPEIIEKMPCPNIEALLDRCQEIGKQLDPGILDDLIEARSREESCTF